MRIMAIATATSKLFRDLVDLVKIVFTPVFGQPVIRPGIGARILTLRSIATISLRPQLE
jgi:hypothetical protein